MKWIKLTKHFRGGSHSDYMYVDEKDLQNEDSKNSLMENWGENSDGGHAYGYRVELEELDGTPPKDWLEKKKIRLEFHLQCVKNAIQRTEDELKMLETLLKA